MKKTLVSALTTALVVGAASTTFAAANPFSDVPADHWAYDAVSQLAADGVIEGYGDTTFRGDRTITRYEMAQMVARAMAKSGVDEATKAMIDKLAAEFADELNNLGIRVAELERNADKVKWTGKAEYTYQSLHVDAPSVYTTDGTPAGAQEFNNGAVGVINSATWNAGPAANTFFKGSHSGKSNNDTLLFRLEPSAEVNDHWHVNARLDATVALDDDNDDDVDLRRIWAQGDYKNFSVRFGKMAFESIEGGQSHAGDLIFDTNFSGAKVTAGSKLKVSVFAGRTDDDSDTGDINNQNWLHTYQSNVALQNADGTYATNVAGAALMTGAQGTKDWSAGNIMAPGGNPRFSGLDDTANVQGINLDYANGKFNAGLSYYHLNSQALGVQTIWNQGSVSPDGTVAYFAGDHYDNGAHITTDANGNVSLHAKDDANIWAINAGYAFDRSSKLSAAYAHNTAADSQNDAWQFEYDYKGGNPEHKGTWGAWVGYRYLGAFTAFTPSTDAIERGYKGFEIGANYVPFKNIIATVRYGHGDWIADNRVDFNKVFGRVEFIF